MNKTHFRNTAFYKCLRHLKLLMEGQYYKNKLKNTNFDIKVLSIEDTIEYIVEKKCSLIRYGDGEINLIAGNDLSAGYQKYDSSLVKKLIEIWNNNGNGYLLCLSDIFNGLDSYRSLSQAFYYKHLYRQGYIYKKYCAENSLYGNTFTTRPYYIFKNKAKSSKYFDKLKTLWNAKNVLLVEGDLSRLGLGNDLFANAASVRRILCPHSNAFNYYKEIEIAIRSRVQPNDIVLVSLGPTAKVIIYDLCNEGIQLVDIGHIDSEYEWFKMGAKTKVDIKNKHSAEGDDSTVIKDVNDCTFVNQIVERIGCDLNEK